MRLRSRRVPHVRVINRSAAATFSSMLHKGKMTSRKRKMIASYRAAASNVYINNDPFFIQPVAQGQAVLDVPSMDKGFLYNAIATVGDTPTAGTVGATARWFLRTAVNTFAFSNQCNMQTFVDMYVYRCRRDTNDTVSDLWSNGLVDQAGGAASYPNSSSYLTYGQSPLDVISTNLFYKLQKVYHHCLNPGQTHEFRHVVSHNKVINNELLRESPGSNYAGTTFRYLFVVRGVPELATNAGGVTTVAEAGGLISMIRTQRLSFAYIKDEDRNMTFYNSLTTGTGMVNFRGVDVRSATVASGSTVTGNGVGAINTDQS